MIPRVREYLITMESGRRYRVLAPSKRLAILNLRLDESAPVWGPIAKVGVARRPVGQRETVKETT